MFRVGVYFVAWISRLCVFTALGKGAARAGATCFKGRARSEEVVGP
jgi:hypothetical protein